MSSRARNSIPSGPGRLSEGGETLALPRGADGDSRRISEYKPPSKTCQKGTRLAEEGGPRKKERDFFACSLGFAIWGGVYARLGKVILQREGRMWVHSRGGRVEAFISHAKKTTSSLSKMADNGTGGSLKGTVRLFVPS